MPRGQVLPVDPTASVKVPAVEGAAVAQLPRGGAAVNRAEAESGRVIRCQSWPTHLRCRGWCRVPRGWCVLCGGRERELGGRQPDEGDGDGRHDHPLNPAKLSLRGDARSGSRRALDRAWPTSHARKVTISADDSPISSPPRHARFADNENGVTGVVYVIKSTRTRLRFGAKRTARRRARGRARVFLRSHEGIGVGSREKVECLGSGADAEVAASVPDVCPDCVRGEYE